MHTTRFLLFFAMAVGLVVLGFGTSQAAVVTLQAGSSGQPADIIQEAMLVEPNANQNFGGRSAFEIGETNINHVRSSVMRFDVTDPSLGLYDLGTPLFSKINSISLRLRTSGMNDNPNNLDLRVAANEEAQGDWVEGTGVSAEFVFGAVTYSERQEGVGTPWNPDPSYTFGTGDGVLGTVTTWPGTGTFFDIDFSPLPGETLTDLVERWATGNNEGVLINDFNRTTTGRWEMLSSEFATVNYRPALTIDYTPVPEPGSLALMGLGLVGLAVLTRRPRRRLQAP